MSFPLNILPAGASPTDRVARKILINGTPLNNEVSVLRISVRKTFQKIASATLIVADGSVAERDFLLSNSELFKPGNEIEIQLGYDENPLRVFKGVIIRHAVKIKQGTYIEIEAKDKAIQLTLGRKSRTFISQEGISDSEIMEEIVGNKLEKDFEPTSVLHSQTVQYNSTDWDFLLSRAEANGQLVLTDDGKIRSIKPNTNTSPELIFTFGGVNNILEFDAEMDVRRQARSIVGNAWYFTDLSVNESSEGEANFREAGNLSSDDLNHIFQEDIILKNAGNRTDAELQQWVDAQTLLTKLAKTSGQLKVQGQPVLKPGQMIRIEGVGDRFNGAVFVTGILHQYNGNFTTSIQFGWAEDAFSHRPEIIEKPASGLVPGLNGLHIGIVQNISDDPENAFRIQVRMPLISESEDGVWARLATLDAGDNRGTFFYPEVGDEVILGFMNDDPRDAVILGMLHSPAHIAPFTPEENNPKKGVVSKNGMKIIFDDDTSTLTLSIPVGNQEKLIVLDGNAGNIELKDEFNNSIRMESSGITIKSGGEVIIESNVGLGKKIKLN